MQDFMENNNNNKKKHNQLSIEIRRTQELLVANSQDCGETNNLLSI